MIEWRKSSYAVQYSRYQFAAKMQPTQTFLNALKYRLVYIWKRPEYQILKENDGGSKSPKSDERRDITPYLPSAVECDAKPKSIKSEDLSFQFLPISIGQVQIELLYCLPVVKQCNKKL